MRKIKLTFLAALSCLAFIGSAHADKTPGEQIDDTAIAGSVKAKLIETKGVPSTAINVEVSGGKVSLGGFVETQQEKQAAIAAAKSVDNVAHVYDGLVVIKKDRTAGQVVDDTTIHATVTAKLAELDASKAWNINSDVYNGYVLLSGFIHGDKSRTAAVEAAKGVKGVKKVYNELELK